MSEEITQLSIATIRSLCIDMINKANSGHPGIALGSAPILYTLFSKHLVANPSDPKWINRDRFVLSAGHGSALLYAMLHLCGYKVSLHDLKNFRQFNSLTPGHPEVNFTDGVDATTGPLGQGIAMAVGMAVAETMVAANYSHGDILCNHYTYCLCGDGCLEEGISQEAISFAGNNHLNKLILLYDSNGITIDGNTNITFSDNTKMRFASVGWNVLEVKDGNNVDEIDNAINEAKKSKDKPTIIVINTVIGFGSSKQGTSKVHGAPLGVEDGKATKVNSYGFDHEDFYIPTEVYDHFNETFKKRGLKYYNRYQEEFVKYSENNKVEVKRFLSLKNGSVADYLPSALPEIEDKPISTRVVSGHAINDYTRTIPNLFGGSADLSTSVMTKLDNGVSYSPEHRDGRTINFGIREFAMGAIQNGILLHGGIRTYVGGFFVFSDYMKPAIRMAALCDLPAIYVFTHDSIAVGEDGPTHQPIEQLVMLRSIPNIQVIRPADALETYAAWQIALRTTNKPTALILTRQNLPILKTNIEGFYKGGYLISKCEGDPQYTIIATGSEVSLALSSQESLKAKGINVDVVNLASWDIFEAQNDEYKSSVIRLDREKCISIEMGSTFGWDKYAKYHIGIDEFGKSGKASDVLDYFGFTPDKVSKFIEEIK